MWRAVSLSIGLSLIFLGLECLFIEQIVVKDFRKKSKTPVANSAYQTASFQTTPISSAASSNPRYIVFKPKEWMPWSLLAAGAVVVIYTFSLPGRSPKVE